MSSATSTTPTRPQTPKRSSPGQHILLRHHTARSAPSDHERADNRTRRAIAARQDARRVQAAANLARDEAHLAIAPGPTAPPWSGTDFQPGDTFEARIVCRTEKYRVVRANAKTLTYRNAFTNDDTKRTYARVLSRTRGGASTTGPGPALPPTTAPAPARNMAPRPAR